jgi:hypothetical protein
LLGCRFSVLGKGPRVEGWSTLGGMVKNDDVGGSKGKEAKIIAAVEWVGSIGNV